MAIREGVWDCPACNGTNRGRQVRCQGCGQARGPDVKFYLPAGEPAILPDNPLYQQAKAGADWICGYCDASNRAGEAKCSGCGASASDGKHRKVQDLSLAAAATPNRPATPPGVPGTAGGPPPLSGAGFAAGGPPPLPGAGFAAGGPPPIPGAGLAAGGPPPIPGVGLPGVAVAPGAAPGAKLPGCNLGCGAVLVFLALLGWWGSLTSELTFKVVSVAWERTIQLEDYRTYQESDWEGSVPAAARVSRREQQVRSHRRVLDHYQTVTRSRRVKVGSEQVVCGQRDLGNGYFEDKYCDQPIYEDQDYETQEPVYRQEPIYDTKVFYEIERWKPTASAVSRGSDLAPAWPVVARHEKLREAGRNGKYTLSVEGPENQRFQHDVPENMFMNSPPGTALVGEVSNFGSLVSLRFPPKP